MAIPQDWKELYFGTKVGCSQELRAAEVLRAPAALSFFSSGGAANEFAALVRRSGTFSAEVLHSKHFLFVRPDSDSVHYLGLMLRNQAARGTPDEVTTADVSGEDSYYVRVNRFAQIEVMQGGITTAQTKLYPAGAGVIAPGLAAVSGYYCYRIEIDDDGSGNARIKIGQTTDAEADVEDDEAFTQLDEFVHSAPEQIVTPGWTGMVFLNGGGAGARIWRVGRYADVVSG